MDSIYRLLTPSRVHQYMYHMYQRCRKVWKHSDKSGHFFHYTANAPVLLSPWTAWPRQFINFDLHSLTYVLEEGEIYKIAPSMSRRCCMATQRQTEHTIVMILMDVSSLWSRMPRASMLSDSEEWCIQLFVYKKLHGHRRVDFVRLFLTGLADSKTVKIHPEGGHDASYTQRRSD